MATTWTTKQAVDNARLKTEKIAFGKLVDELGATWKGIVQQYAETGSAASSGE